jgi:hypothetical protein
VQYLASGWFGARAFVLGLVLISGSYSGNIHMDKKGKILGIGERAERP